LDELVLHLLVDGPGDRLGLLKGILDKAIADLFQVALELLGLLRVPSKSLLE